MKYRREIDGLRALAVISVILFHAGFETFSGGFVGVDVFFVISGYLITTIIIAELEYDKFSIVSFYERRARRILPALFFVMLVCIPFAWFWLLPSGMKEFSKSLVAVSVFASNILFWRESGYFGTAAELKPLLHTWSLAVEEQFYVLFPLFLMLFWKLGKRWILVTLGLVFVASLALAQWAAYSKPSAAFYLLPTRGWELLIGAFAAFYLSKINRKEFSKVFSEIGGWLGVALILYAVFTYSKVTPFPGLYALVPTLGTVLIILFATYNTTVGKFVGNKAFVGIGLISYSAYLWHQPIFAFARERSIDEISLYLMSTLALLCFAFAYLSWKYVEQPFRNKLRISRNKVFAYSALCSALFIGLGLAGYLSVGFIYRFSPSDRYLASLSASEAGDYVQKRFNELSMRQFDKNDKKLKVLIIGDSYAQDLVNAIHESDFDNVIQISTRHISARCGNLFIKRNLFVDKISDIDKRTFCNIDENKELYDDEKLRKLMLSADEIWLASSWRYWQTELIKESVNNISSFSNKKIKVFGKKDFGIVSIKNLLNVNEKDRMYIRGDISQQTVETNSLLEKELSGLLSTNFINIQKLICGVDVQSCPLFTDEGFLISYDGGHLTKFGAKYYGEKLYNDNALKRLLY